MTTANDDHHGDATRREGNAPFDDRTRREDTAGSPPPRGDYTRRDGEAARSGPGDWQLPPGLAERFTIIEGFATMGTEADVFKVRRRETNEIVVLKLYRHGFEPDPEALASLIQADKEHVVQIFAHGREDGRYYEVQEFCVGGTMRELTVGGLTAEDIVRELAPAIEHVHSLGIVHRDLKPSNIFVRSTKPFDLVLGDFGLVRQLAMGDHYYTQAWGTAQYSPPEGLAGDVSNGTDWWALGMMIAEHAGGVHPLAHADGVAASPQQIQSELAQRDVPLDLVKDERVKLLCRGLLTRDRAQRWGAAQVREWLAGGSPTVYAAQPTATANKTSRVTFQGTIHDDPKELAAALQRNWNDAAQLLFQAKDTRLIKQLEVFLRDRGMDDALESLKPGSVDPARMFWLLPRFLADLDPDLAPIYNGTPLTVEGLHKAAQSLIAAPASNPVDERLGQVLQSDVLTVWCDLPGMGHAAEVSAEWSRIVKDLSNVMASVSDRAQLTDDERAIARGVVLECALDDGFRQSAAKQLSKQTLRNAELVPWWKQLREADDAASFAVMYATTLRAAELGATRRAEMDAEQRSKALRRQRPNRILLGAWFVITVGACIAGAALSDRIWPTWPARIMVDSDHLILDAFERAGRTEMWHRGMVVTAFAGIAFVVLAIGAFIRATGRQRVIVPMIALLLAGATFIAINVAPDQFEQHERSELDDELAAVGRPGATTFLDTACNNPGLVTTSGVFFACTDAEWQPHGSADELTPPPTSDSVVVTGFIAHEGATDIAWRTSFELDGYGSGGAHGVDWQYAQLEQRGQYLVLHDDDTYIGIGLFGQELWRHTIEQSTSNGIIVPGPDGESWRTSVFQRASVQLPSDRPVYWVACYSGNTERFAYLDIETGQRLEGSTC